MLNLDLEDPNWLRVNRIKITTLESSSKEELEKAWFHEHDGFPEHPIAVKFHEKYFAGQRAKLQETKPSEEERPQVTTPSTSMKDIFVSSPITSKETLRGGINAPEKIKLSQDGEAILKFPRYEITGFAYKHGEQDSPYNEVAAYEVAKKLGLGDMVPETYFRTREDGRLGTIQKFIPNAEVYQDARLRGSPRLRASARKGYLFDIIIGSTDRHSGNILISEGKLFLIDNGRAFLSGHNALTSYNDLEHKLDSILATAIGQDLILRDDDRAFLSYAMRMNYNDLVSAGILTPIQVEDMLERIKAVLAAGRFPSYIPWRILIE